MIIPIGHDQTIRRHPVVTYVLIGLCTLLQLYASFGNAEGLDSFVYVTGTGASLTLLTSAFLHVGWLHLIGNMLFLWLAGSPLEDRYGRVRFTLVFVLGAIVANVAFSLFSPAGVPIVGASGAVSALMGAFLVHFRHTQIRFWYWLGRGAGTFYWPAWFALPLWLLEQFVSDQLQGTIGGGVAYGAHIGGFVFGIVIAFAMRMLFPGDSSDGEEIEAPATRSVAEEAGAFETVDQRIARCHAALQARDTATVRTLASRVILDLARVENYSRIREVYAQVEKHMSKPPLTDAAFAAAATAADRVGDTAAYIAIASTMLSEHGGSPAYAPRIMWRLAQIHGDAGNQELERDTLRTLATRFPRDGFGQKARAALDVTL